MGTTNIVAWQEYLGHVQKMNIWGHITLLVASQLSTYNMLNEIVFKIIKHDPFFIYYRVCLEAAGKMLCRYNRSSQ